MKEKGLLKTEKTVKLNVRRGSSKRLEFVTDEKNCALNYAFQTDNHDIGFGIFRAKNPKDAIKDMTPLVLPRRLNCHLVPESGSLRLTEIGLCNYCVNLFSNIQTIITSIIIKNLFSFF